MVKIPPTIAQRFVKKCRNEWLDSVNSTIIGLNSNNTKNPILSYYCPKKTYQAHHEQWSHVLGFCECIWWPRIDSWLLSLLWGVRKLLGQFWQNTQTSQLRYSRAKLWSLHQEDWSYLADVSSLQYKLNLDIHPRKTNDEWCGSCWMHFCLGWIIQNRLHIARFVKWTFRVQC